MSYTNFPGVVFFCFLFLFFFKLDLGSGYYEDAANWAVIVSKIYTTTLSLCGQEEKLL